MQLPAHRQSWLTRPRIVGTPLRWSSHAGALGTLLGGLSPFMFLGPAMTNPYAPIAQTIIHLWLLAEICLVTAGVGGVLGAIVGLSVPSLLDRTRGRWPLPVIALSASGVGAAIGAITMGSFWIYILWLSSPRPPLSEVFILGAYLMGAGTVVGAIATALWWLPFAMATVLGRRWPVTSVVGLSIPALLSLSVLRIFWILLML